MVSTGCTLQQAEVQLGALHFSHPLLYLSFELHTK